MFGNHELAEEAGTGLSVYEINHHTTAGNAPPEPRNRLVTSLGGGLNVVNSMLLMLREHQTREQCLFTLAQHSYHGADIGALRLWGTALSMRAGHERYRPTFLAVAAANRVIAGDLVETVQQGAQPTFTATGIFNHRDGVRTVSDIPALWTYGFADGDIRGLIVINLDTSHDHQIAVNYSGSPKGRARSWLLTADAIAANNEFEQPEPQVHLREAVIENLAPGNAITIPRHSMLVLRWQVQQDIKEDS